MTDKLISGTGKVRTVQEQETKQSLTPSDLGQVCIVPTCRPTFTSESVQRRLMSRCLLPFTLHHLFTKKQQIKLAMLLLFFYLAETLASITDCLGRKDTMALFSSITFRKNSTILPMVEVGFIYNPF